MPRISALSVPRSFAGATPIIAALALAAVSAAVPLSAQEANPDRITVLGRILDAQTGAPIPGAVVRVSHNRTSVMTDEAGSFALAGMEPGVLTLLFEQLGYTNIALTQSFEAGDPPLSVEMEPQPVVLEGLEVMVDRFRQRRFASGVSVRVLDAESFSASPSDLLSAVRIRGGLGLMECRQQYSTATWCLRSRGRLLAPTVVIDDRPAMGLEELALYRTDEIYAVEIYRMGQHVRVYTRNYMSSAAFQPRAVSPLGW